MKGIDVHVKNLIKIYKTGKVEVQALRGVNLDVESGSIVAIIGPSGSGKTTLLNLIGGLDYPTGGTVKVGDIVVSNLSPSQLINYRRKYVGFVFQLFNLIPDLTVEENIELPMISLGVPKQKRKDTIEMLLDILGIKNKRYQFPSELRGGEQQRVAIAVALANDPPLILADEPTGELDSANTRIITDYFSKINQEFKKTIIIVTHDPNVTKIAHEIYRIEDGMIKGRFIPSQVYSTTSASYSEYIRKRIEELDEQLRKLDEEFKQGRIDSDKYIEDKIRLKQRKQILLEELQ